MNVDRVKALPPSDFEPGLWRWWVLAAALVFLFSLIGILLSRQPGSIATLWYANAIGTIALFCRPRRDWPLLLLAMLLANLLANLVVGDSLLASLAFLPGNGLEMLIGASLLRRGKVVDEMFTNPAALLKVMAIAGVAPCLVGATLGSAVIAWEGFATFSLAWPRWFAGSLLGTLSILPLGLYASQRDWRELIDTLCTLEAVMLIAASLGLALIVSVTLPLPLVYISLPLVFAAVRMGFLVTAVASLLVSLVVGGLIAQGVLLPPPSVYEWGHLLFYLAFLAALLPAMVLAVSVEGGRAMLRERDLSRSRAEYANHAKTRFLANMSHEIRTPLTAIVGLAQLLDDGGLPVHQKGNVQRLRSAAQSLREVVDDILDFTRVEAGHMTLERKPFSLDTLVREVHSVLAASVTDRAIQVSLSLDPAIPPVVLGDSFRLRQVLMNLAGNAIKFTPQGQVHLVVRALPSGSAHSRVEFSVIDEGIGIAEENLESIFDEFAQADSSITRRFGGTGLGLSISQHIVTLMASKIHVLSAQGKGSTFWFSVDFPVGELPVVAESSMPPASTSMRLAGLRILVVEDNALSSFVICELLRRESALVETASSGEAALRRMRFQSDTPDAVLMDVHMPDINGLDVARQIRAMEKHRALPIIAMTADVLPEDRLASMGAGMNAHIGKPLDIDTLVHCLQSLCGLRRRDEASVSLATGRVLRQLPEVAGFELNASLHRLGDDTALFARAARRFRAVHGGLPARLAAWQLAGDIPRVRHALHTLKGTAMTLGALAVASSATSLSEQLTTPDPERRAALVNELSVRIEEACAVLEAAADFLDTPMPDTDTR